MAPVVVYVAYYVLRYIIMQSTLHSVSERPQVLVTLLMESLHGEPCCTTRWPGSSFADAMPAGGAVLILD
jgi:hypothetical protein